MNKLTDEELKKCINIMLSRINNITTRTGLDNALSELLSRLSKGEKAIEAMEKIKKLETVEHYGRQGKIKVYLAYDIDKIIREWEAE